MIARRRAVPVGGSLIHVKIINEAFGRNPRIGTLPAAVGMEVAFVVDALIEFTVAENWLHSGSRKKMTLGARGYLTGGYMLITLWFFKQFVHTFPRGDMLITF